MDGITFENTTASALALMGVRVECSVYLDVIKKTDLVLHEVDGIVPLRPLAVQLTLRQGVTRKMRSFIRYSENHRHRAYIEAVGVGPARVAEALRGYAISLRALRHPVTEAWTVFPLVMSSFNARELIRLADAGLDARSSVRMGQGVLVSYDYSRAYVTPEDGGPEFYIDRRYVKDEALLRAMRAGLPDEIRSMVKFKEVRDSQGVFRSDLSLCR